MAKQIPLSWDDIQARKKPARSSMLVVLDSEAADALESAKAAVSRWETEARLALDGTEQQRQAQERLAEAHAEHDRALAAAEQASTEFKFVALSRPAYEELIDAHPPTEVQKNEAKRKGRSAPLYNDETLPPALVAATLVEPKLSEDQALEMWSAENWNTAELLGMFFTARDVCERRRVVDLGKGSQTILD